jgi:hypothetical protein
MDIDDEMKSIEAATRLRRKQVGGTHYEDMGLEPVEATYMRYGYAGVKAALHCKIDKYIGRDKHDELADLKKARHCIDMLIEYKEKEDE